MASPASPPEPPARPLRDFGAALARRRAEQGNPELPRNSGTRRTPAKQALLAAIRDAGGDW